MLKEQEVNRRFDALEKRMKDLEEENAKLRSQLAEPKKPQAKKPAAKKAGGK